MFDPDRARQVAAALQTNETYIEKDWHLVRALGVIAAIHVAGVTPVFSGGTSLARAWQLINRFSEDIDFKVIVAADSAAAERRSRKACRESVVKALTEADFVLDGEPLVSNEGRFFRVKFHYGATLPAAPGIRPSLQIEMTFTGTHLPPVLRPVQSLLAFATKTAPEVPELLCVDPVETAADKLSALAWRTATRDRSADKDDPSVIRHLHDLAALAPRVKGNPELTSLTRKLLQIDARERAKMPEADSLTMLSAMLPAIVSDPLWRKEYEEFVDAVSFGPDDARITFDQAVAAGQALVATVAAV